ncbi:hypothetical protein [Gottfriedia acidiceleris]|uniref:hypothetical protein n=1 Tax=Gottfriedia acidiceleris TaxID=371036 RepID=UPI003D223117
MKKRIIISIILAILLLSGVHFTFKDALIYAFIYLIGKTLIYYFESKKINWNQNIKDFAFFVIFTFSYYICYLVLESFGFKSIKFFSSGIALIGGVLGGIGFIYIVFVVPYKILTKKASKK